MSIQITSDSTCDLSPALLEKHGIELVALSVTLGEKTGLDGLDMTPEDIYTYVAESGQLPKTSATNLAGYIDFFQKQVDAGHEVVHFSLSSEFSSTYRNACLAAQEFEQVYVVDSRNLSTGQGLLVLRAAELAAQGVCAKEIAETCTALAEKVDASFVIDNLDYLHKGGRCSAVAALGANLLRLKPCINVQNGKMNVGKKYKGKIGNVMLEYVTDRLTGRDDIDKSRIFVTHTKCDPADVEAVRQKVLEICPDFSEVLETTAGCTITTHCGPGTLGILFLRK